MEELIDEIRSNYPELLKPSEARSLCRIGSRQIYELIEEHDLGIRINNQTIRVIRSRLIQYLKEQFNT